MTPAASIPTQPLADWHSTEPWVRRGTLTVVWLVGGLSIWSALVPISGAVVAGGTVRVEGNYKSVQHLDGGIVAKILVKDGDRVKAGDVLLKLDDTAARASLAVASGRVSDYKVQIARLEAERDRRASFALPADLDRKNPDVEKIAATQQSMFAARRTSHQGELSVLKQRLDQIEGESRSVAVQLAARTKEREINARELASVMPLFEQGYVTQPRISALQRELARLDGEIGRLNAEADKTRASKAEADLRIAQIEKAFTEKVVDELRKAEASLAEEIEKQRSLSDKVSRIDIRAPSDGRVHSLAAHTEGGVITPASTILQIVPEAETLLVEAQLAPRDVDKVGAGQHATVRFSAFNAHTTPRIAGSVLKVSPAEMTDGRGRDYFTAEVAIPPGEIAKLGKDHALKPGMPAEVYIETTSRSILSYFVKPLADAMGRAFREE